MELGSSNGGSKAFENNLLRSFSPLGQNKLLDSVLAELELEEQEEKGTRKFFLPIFIAYIAAGFKK